MDMRNTRRGMNKNTSANNYTDEQDDQDEEDIRLTRKLDNMN